MEARQFSHAFPPRPCQAVRRTGSGALLASRTGSATWVKLSRTGTF